MCGWDHRLALETHPPVVVDAHIPSENAQRTQEEEVQQQQEVAAKSARPDVGVGVDGETMERRMWHVWAE